MLEIVSRPGWIGSLRTIEEITASLPRYPDGRSVMRGRVVARRLEPILKLVSRGPNGSLGIGALYSIVEPPPEPVVHELVDDVWIQDAVSMKLELERDESGSEAEERRGDFRRRLGRKR